MVDKGEASSVSLESNSFARKPSSVFGEDNLGEPLVGQRVVLNFAPMQEFDNKLVQRKCIAFWEYIKSRHDLHHILVLPDDVLVTKPMQNTLVTESELPPPAINETALSVLENYEEQGTVNSIFETKLHKSHCSLGSQEYSQAESTKAVPVKLKTCCCSKICKMCRMVPKNHNSVHSNPKVQALCQKLQLWDTNHPKSMEPPGQVPVLSQCIMQRKMIS